ncbi:Phage Tail Collar Domain protein [Roseovarius albus]|uniref:Phage Tail Collar Domain protein n=1 Tax=Roseovarius albus TaxID=1247867 RepID=A0A1X6ZXD8_9RHOB|nr:tail fiber protein [Roseovarius albus]SLN64438.1 Phage Tail Collar Domain protein [Roseovarius albus]
MEPFIAQIMLFAGGYAPQGWAFCDGQTLPISGNEDLFSLIGTTYGGDGRTTFALPDLRGRVPVHAGQGPGLTRRTLGQKFGDESVVTDGIASMPMIEEERIANVASGHSNVVKGVFGSAQRCTRSPATVVASDPPGMEAHSSHRSHGDSQPSLCVNYIIALKGIYPPRS